MTNTPTLDEILELAQRLPIDDQQRLVRLLNPPKTIEQIAAEQGIGPFDFKAAQAEAMFWPEDENIDDFTAFIRESRRGSAPESRAD
jgi:hypothetical protein